MSSKTKQKILGNKDTIVGRNINTKLTRFAQQHPGSAEAGILTLLKTQKAKARITEPIKSIEFDFDEKPYSTAEIENQCFNCKSGLKHMRKADMYINGKTVNFGETGNNLGEDCYDIITGLAEGLKHSDYRPRIIEKREQKQRIESAAKAKMRLDQLAVKVVEKLRAQDIDLTQRIRADIADEIQDQVMRGEFSGLERELDPGRFMDIYGWAIAHSHEITDKRIRRTIALLTTQEERVSQADLHDLVLWEYQKRPWATSGELGGVKEDILYLADLSEKRPEHPVIKKYGKVDLDKELTPIKIWDRAIWEKITLRDAVGDTPEERKNKKEEEIKQGRPAITKAQGKAAKYAVPYLRERRIEHNREIVRKYCSDPDEFAKLLENVEQRYLKEKADYAGAKKARIREPAGYWTAAYKKLAPFFSLKEEIYKTRAKPTLRQILLSYVFMQDADKTTRRLYIEGKKLDLAAKLGKEDVLGQAYSTVQEAADKLYTAIPEAERMQKFNENLDKLLNGAIEFDEKKDGKKIKRVPRRTQERFTKAGMTQQRINNLMADVQESISTGLIPTKYLQPDGKKVSMLERALKITADYQKDEETVKHISYLRQLESELSVKIDRVRADDGKTAFKKSDPGFSTKCYDGKTYFSPKQKEAVNNLYGMLNTELKELNIPQAKKAAEQAEKFFEDHKIYTARRWGAEKTGFSLEQEDPRYRYGLSIQYKPFKQYIQAAEEIQKFKEGKESKYVRLNQRLRERILGLQQSAGLPKNINEILEDQKTMLTRDAVDAINSRYQAIAERVISKGAEKYQNPSMRYFDIIATSTHPVEEEGRHRLAIAFGQKHNQGKAILYHAKEEETYEKGRFSVPAKTWFGHGSSRDYVEKVCARADAAGYVNIKIVNARK